MNPGVAMWISCFALHERCVEGVEGGELELLLVQKFGEKTS